MDLELRLLPSTGVIRLRWYYEPHRHPKRPGLSLTGVRFEGETTPSPHGLPVLRCISMCRHAVVNPPVARWALIARGTAYFNRFPVPSGGGLPHIHARSATTLDVSRPAQRSLALRPVGSPSRQSDPSVSKASTVSFPPRVASIATGWSDPVAGWDLHPLKINTFLSRLTGLVSPELWCPRNCGTPELLSPELRNSRPSHPLTSCVPVSVPTGTHRLTGLSSSLRYRGAVSRSQGRGIEKSKTGRNLEGGAAGVSSAKPRAADKRPHPGIEHHAGDKSGGGIGE